VYSFYDRRTTIFCGTAYCIAFPMSLCHALSLLILKHLQVHLKFNQNTAKTQYRKFETNVPRKGIARPQLPISTFWYLWSAYSAAGKYVDRSWEYINRSYTHECGNWDWGRAISFLGTHKWDFLCIVPQERSQGHKSLKI
jgi:hypothetical protein